VHACGGDNYAHEAKMGRVKTCLFLDLSFLWIVMYD
jgi:hypothetical protein